jgi:hypothetical protein
MPYIKSDRREGLESLDFIPENNGELNFVLTTIINRYLVTHGHKYTYINDILGALEGCKLEFYRRVVAPYENLKCQENGDVYE